MLYMRWWEKQVVFVQKANAETGKQLWKQKHTQIQDFKEKDTT